MQGTAVSAYRRPFSVPTEIDTGVAQAYGSGAPASRSAFTRQMLWGPSSETGGGRVVDGGLIALRQAMPRNRRPRNTTYPMPPTTTHEPAISAAQTTRIQARCHSMGKGGAWVVGDRLLSSIATLFMALL